MYELKAEAHFDSAHFLADYHGRCENLHGHRWSVTATIGTDVLSGDGDAKDMVMDFSEFKSAVRSLASELDHTFLVEVGTLSVKTVDALHDEGFTLKMLPFRTTAENLARYLFERLSDEGLPVLQVEVDETPENRAIYKASDPMGTGLLGSWRPDGDGRP